MRNTITIYHCDRCKAEVEYTNNGKKVTGGCDINIGIDKIKGKQTKLELNIITIINQRKKIQVVGIT